MAIPSREGFRDYGDEAPARVESLQRENHALQTAEALRADGQPRWLVPTGLLHDLGKVLCLFGEPHCGLDALHVSWGHDEYLYHVLRGYLPQEALDVIRYHSFHAGHEAGAHAHLLGPRDAERLAPVRRFGSYDLYSKAATPVDVAALRPFYEDLAAAYLPDDLRW